MKRLEFVDYVVRCPFLNEDIHVYKLCLYCNCYEGKACDRDGIKCAYKEGDLIHLSRTRSFRDATESR